MPDGGYLYRYRSEMRKLYSSSFSGYRLSRPGFYLRDYDLVADKNEAIVRVDGTSEKVEESLYKCCPQR